MNMDTVQGNWTELKGKIKAKWGKFTDNDIESLKGHLEQLSGKLQKTYGLARDQAEREAQEFQAAFEAKSTFSSKSQGGQSKRKDMKDTTDDSESQTGSV